MELWIGRDGERHGPYKEDDVRQWLRSGQVSTDDLAWHEGLADWQPLSVIFPDNVTQTPPPGDIPALSAAPLPQTTTAALEDYAGFWKRVAAYIIDAIILYIPSSIIEKMMGGDAAQQAMKAAATSAAGDIQAIHAAQLHYIGVMWPSMLIIAIMSWMYFALLESSKWQATLGKLALGLRVTDLKGQCISLPRALGRYPAKYISAIILGIGFLMVAWTKRKQGLHDLMADTLVLNGRASEFNAEPTSTGNKNSFSA